MTGQGPSGNDIQRALEFQTQIAEARFRVTAQRMLYGGLYRATWVRRKPFTGFEKVAGRLVAFWVLALVVRGRTA